MKRKIRLAIIFSFFVSSLFFNMQKQQYYALNLNKGCPTNKGEKPEGTIIGPYKCCPDGKWKEQCNYEINRFISFQSIAFVT